MPQNRKISLSLVIDDKKIILYKYATISSKRVLEQRLQSLQKINATYYINATFPVSYFWQRLKSLLQRTKNQPIFYFVYCRLHR